MAIHFALVGMATLAVAAALGGLAFATLSIKLDRRKRGLDVTTMPGSILKIAEERPFFNFMIMSAIVGLLVGSGIVLLLAYAALDLRGAVQSANQAAAYVFLLVLAGTLGEILWSSLSGRA